MTDEATTAVAADTTAEAPTPADTTTTTESPTTTTAPDTITVPETTTVAGSEYTGACALPDEAGAADAVGSEPADFEYDQASDRCVFFFEDPHWSVGLMVSPEPIDALLAERATVEFTALEGTDGRAHISGLLTALIANGETTLDAYVGLHGDNPKFPTNEERAQMESILEQVVRNLSANTSG